jgi:hypothetical protein
MPSTNTTSTTTLTEAAQTFQSPSPNKVTAKSESQSSTNRIPKIAHLIDPNKGIEAGKNQSQMENELLFVQRTHPHFKLEKNGIVTEPALRSPCRAYEIVGNGNPSNQT